MAADPTLAQGAYRASKHYDMGLRDSKRRLAGILQKGIPQREQGTEQPTKKAKSTSAKPSVTPDIESQKVTTENDPNSTKIVPEDDSGNKNNPDENLEKLAEEEALTGEGVTGTDTENLRTELEINQGEFHDAVVNKDNPAVERLQQDLKNKKDQIDDFDDIFKGVNENYLNRGQHTSYGYGNAFTSAPKEEQEWIMNMITSGRDGVGKLEKFPDDPNYYVEMPDPESGGSKFVTSDVLRKELEKYEMANEQFNQIHDLSLHYREDGKNAGKTGMFNFDKAKTDITRIVESGGAHTMTSLALDKSFGNTSYAEDLFSSDDLSSITYEDVGLDPAEYDTDGDGLITPKDNISDDIKNQIIQTLTSDPKYRDGLKESMVNYYTKHLERNFNAEHALRTPLNMGGMRNGTGNGMPNLFPGQTVGDKSYAPTYTMSVDDLTNIE